MRGMGKRYSWQAAGQRGRKGRFKPAYFRNTAPQRSVSARFIIALVAMFAAVFTAVFFWNPASSASQAATSANEAALANAPDAETLRRKRWARTPADLESAQPIMAPAAAQDDATSTRFTRCSGAVRITCVVDGDTIWLNGTKIRIADIDTPEISRPGCAAERQLGKAATARLQTLLNAGPITVAANPSGRDTDRYGRKLRVIMRGGQSLGAQMVAEGLAKQWGGPRINWC